MAFEPFIDFESVTPEQAAELHQALRDFRMVALSFEMDDEPEIGKAQRVLRAAHEANQCLNRVLTQLYVMPALVHVAGPCVEEYVAEDAEEMCVIQRCARCGSVLNFWMSGATGTFTHGSRRVLELEEIPWWPEGALVAKANTNLGTGVYQVDPGRTLEKYELECADLSALGA